jgi:TolA-binding protein
VLLVAAGIAAAVAATRGGGGHRAAPPKPTTIVRTVTGAGVTVEETVTAPAAEPASTSVADASPPTTAPAPTDNGVALNDAGYAKMQAGDYRGALPLLQQAVAKLQGSGSTAEAYADYNLAYTRFALGDCTDVIALLDHSEQIQGKRPEIDKLRRDATKSGC